MLSVENVAMPLTAATVTAPESVPPLVLVPIPSVTLFVAVGTVLPSASWIATCTAGVSAAPDVAPLGCTRKPSFVGGAEMMNDAVTVSSAVSVRVQVVPVPEQPLRTLSVHPVNDASAAGVSVNVIIEPNGKDALQVPVP